MCILASEKCFGQWAVWADRSTLNGPELVYLMGQPLLLLPPAAATQCRLKFSGFRVLYFQSSESRRFWENCLNLKEMSRQRAVAFLAGRIAQLGRARVQVTCVNYNTLVESRVSKSVPWEMTSYGKSIVQHQPQIHLQKSSETTNNPDEEDAGIIRQFEAGKHISRKDKVNFLLTTLHDLKDNKEAVYGALDAWVAWEQNFPIASIKRALLVLEKEQQWHRIIQVLKWMLSKGQGTTMGTYQQLIKALDMDQRFEEARNLWVKQIGNDLHSVPWQFCKLMISIYYRNNMLERLIKLFKGLEAFHRKPQEKAVVQKVANTYEMLGLLDEKNRIVEKYSDLFNETKSSSKKSKKELAKKKTGQSKETSTGDEHTNAASTVEGKQEHIGAW